MKPFYVITFRRLDNLYLFCSKCCDANLYYSKHVNVVYTYIQEIMIIFRGVKGDTRVIYLEGVSIHIYAELKT